MKDLGCMNGWAARVWTKADGSKFVEKEDTTPEEYKKCKSGCHHEFVSVRKLGNCRHEYSCEICNIKYNVDSSD